MVMGVESGSIEILHILKYILGTPLYTFLRRISTYGQHQEVSF